MFCKLYRGTACQWYRAGSSAAKEALKQMGVSIPEETKKDTYQGNNIMIAKLI